MPKNTAASVRQRLLNLARERHEDIEDASSFIEVMQDLQRFLEPVYQAIADERPYPYQWSQGEFKWMDA